MHATPAKSVTARNWDPAINVQLTVDDASDEDVDDNVNQTGSRAEKQKPQPATDVTRGPSQLPELIVRVTLVSAENPDETEIEMPASQCRQYNEYRKAIFERWNLNPARDTLQDFYEAIQGLGADNLVRIKGHQTDWDNALSRMTFIDNGTPILELTVEHETNEIVPQKKRVLRSDIVVVDDTARTAGLQSPPNEIDRKRTRGEQEQLFAFCRSLWNRDMLDSTRPVTAPPGNVNMDPEAEDGSPPCQTLLTHGIIQELLAAPSSQYDDVNEAIEHLQAALGVDSPLIYGLGPQRGLATDTLPIPGERHLEHQICFLAWALSMEVYLKGGICGDAMGMGKTHQIISLIQAATYFWTRHGRSPCRPTLVVCNNTTRKKWVLELHKTLGSEWQVFDLGDRPQPALSWSKKNIALHEKSRLFTGSDLHRRVLVTSYDQIQTMSASLDYKGLFVRVILDEAQGIRRYEEGKRGQLLESLDAEFRWAFTGTVAHNSIEDVRGLLAFLARPGWGEPTDRNETIDGRINGGPNMRYLDFKDRLRTCQEIGLRHIIPSQRTHIDPPPADWESACNSIDKDMSPHQWLALIHDDWLCGHFPAMLFYNADREESVDSKRRYGPTRRREDNMSADRSTSKRRQKADRPFLQNPFDLYHADNKNKLRCCTVAAFNYWLKPHIGSLRSPGNHKKLSERIQIIFDILLLARNEASLITCRDGIRRRVQEIGELAGVPPLPDMNVYTQDLCLSTTEQADYDAKESNCGRTFDFNYTEELLQLDPVEQDKRLAEEAKGSRFQQILTLTTHTGLYGLRKTNTSQWRRWKTESLPALLNRMKRTKSLNPADQNTPVVDDEDVLRQFLWGSPKFRYAIEEIRKVVLNTEPGHKKVIGLFLFHRSADAFRKVSIATLLYLHELTLS